MISMRRSVLVPLLGATALALSACGSDEPPITVAPASPTEASCDPGIDTPLSQWSEVGMSGSIALLGGDRPCIAAYGLADSRDGRSNTLETAFSIGSITKAVTAAGVLKLADEGVVSIDEPAGTYVSGLSGPAADLVLRDLLLHTSGLTGDHGRDHVALSEKEAIASISGLKTSFPAGRRFLYGNANYTLLGLVIEAVTEEGYRGYLIENILRDSEGTPLGGFWDGEPAVRGPRAFNINADGTPREVGDFAGPHWALDGNGGIAMTPIEMANWARALFGGEILSAAATKQLTELSTTLGGDGTEIPGWVVLDKEEYGEPIFVSSGGGGSIGHSMNVGVFPESDRVFAIAENKNSLVSNDWLGDTVGALIAGTGIPGPPDLIVPTPEQEKATVGAYRLGDETIRITREQDGFAVFAEGPVSTKTLVPSPEKVRLRQEKHEELSVAFAEGKSPEGKRERDTLEARYGLIDKVTLIGSVYDGGIFVTYLNVRLEDGSTQLLDLELNDRGGSEGIGGDDWPSRWFTLQDDGTLAAWRPYPGQPPVSLKVTDEGLEITGPDGVVTAARIG